MTLLRMHGAVQNYAWGKPGLESTVAQLIEAAGKGVDEEKPYAEYWMGTHVNGPGRVEVDGKICPLFKLLEEKPHLLSINDGKSLEGGLPYLFKILSVNKALSIQAHPSKKYAEELHEKFPHIYKDPNHKPELALALTDFEALVGFKNYEEIYRSLEMVPELGELLKDIVNSDEYHSGTDVVKLKVLFEALMNLPEEIIAEKVEMLGNRLTLKLKGAKDLDVQKPMQEGEDLDIFTEKLALRLLLAYPGDVGVFCAFFLNYKCLKPGEGIFLSANEPHAYLQGDCAEIMANSDNVVRAGLTPKLRDVPTLCSMLQYKPFDPSKYLLKGKPIGEFVKRYAPSDDAVDEFELEKLNLPLNQSTQLAASSFASILLVLDGSCNLQLADQEEKAQRGSLYFLGAGASLTVQAHGDQDTILLRATTKGAFLPSN